MEDGGLTSVFVLFLFWVVISVITYIPPPPTVYRKDYVGRVDTEPEDGFINTVMWLNQDD
jgi:hypothetical protein|tara:strand:+ start:5925 stop:6104 length:180 start_codon:yes stop_codon:yes gene_type:complete